MKAVLVLHLPSTRLLCIHCSDKDEVSGGNLTKGLGSLSSQMSTESGSLGSTPSSGSNTTAPPSGSSISYSSLPLFNLTFFPDTKEGKVSGNVKRKYESQVRGQTMM